jgi:hypothetical protein
MVNPFLDSLSDDHRLVLTRDVECVHEPVASGRRSRSISARTVLSP